METLNRNLKDLSIEYPKPFENDAKKSESDNSAALPHLFLFLLFFSECNNIICFFLLYSFGFIIRNIWYSRSLNVFCFKEFTYYSWLG